MVLATMSKIIESRNALSQSEQTFLRWLTWIGFVPAMFSVILQMNSVHGGFLTNYLADLAGPIWCYGTIRQKKTLFKKVLSKVSTPGFAAIFVFLVGTSWEVCQAIDFSGTPLGITRGRFDPLDIVAFAVSLAACYAADKIFAHKINLAQERTSSRT